MYISACFELIIVQFSYQFVYKLDFPPQFYHIANYDSMFSSLSFLLLRNQIRHQ